MAMRRNYDFPSRPQHGWNTTSQDYHAHLSRMERMPSVLTDVPHYPNVHKAFNNNYYSYDQEEKQEVLLENQKQNSVPMAEKKVHIAEHVETIEENKDGSYEFSEESIDVEASGFIQEKHKRFDLCKWKTFKAN